MLVDSYSRTFSYLRLSLTEKCNFRCRYCLPNGYKTEQNGTGFLSLTEIENLASAFKSLGVRKIRLTGGEPTLRVDLVEIIQVLKEKAEIPTVALTTNGFQLGKMLGPLKSAGLDALNVSLDSFDRSTFQDLCGSKLGASVLESLEAALAMSFSQVKVNCVLLKGLNDHEFQYHMDFVKERDVSVRFIELMRTGDNREFFERHHIALETFEELLLRDGWSPTRRDGVSGPAKEYSHPEYRGNIGFISPYGRGFCESCNRLRVSAHGKLRLCLFGDGEVSLRRLLQSQQDQDELKELICSSLQIKPMGHRLHENIYGMTESLSSIGG